MADRTWCMWTPTCTEVAKYEVALLQDLAVMPDMRGARMCESHVVIYRTGSTEFGRCRRGRARNSNMLESRR